MIAAAECRELAKSFRAHAAEAGSSQKASLFRNIARSFSALATQLEGLADMNKPHGIAHMRSRVQGQEVPPRSRSADTNNDADAVIAHRERPVAEIARQSVMARQQHVETAIFEEAHQSV